MNVNAGQTYFGGEQGGPMTPEQSQEAYDNAPAVDLSDEQIDRIIARLPATPPPALINRNLAHAVARVLCDEICPSKKKAGEPWPHKTLCLALHRELGIEPR